MLALGAMWGSSFLFMRIAVPSMGAPALVEGRVLIAAIAITIAAKIAGQRLPRGAEWRPCIWIGVFYTAVPLLMWAWAAHTMHASLLSIINATAPLFGAVVAALWFRERLNMLGIAGLVLGFAGVALLVGGDIATNVASSASAVALAAAFGAALLYGIMANYSGAAQRHITPWTQALGSMWVAVIVTLPVVFIFYSGFSGNGTPSGSGTRSTLRIIDTSE